MKRSVAAIAIPVLVLAGATAALAGAKGYSGSIQPSGTISLKVVQNDGKRSIKKGLHFAGIPMTCNEEIIGEQTQVVTKQETLAPYTVLKSAKVKKSGKFTLQFHGDQSDNDGTITGKVKGGSASGTIQLDGTVGVTTNEQGLIENCHSGVLQWSAK
jgi:hypothetical protein